MKLKMNKKKYVLELTEKEMSTLEYLLDIAQDSYGTGQYQKEIRTFYTIFFKLMAKTSKEVIK